MKRVLGTTLIRNEKGAIALFLVLLLAVLAAVPLMLQVSAGSRLETRHHLNTAAQADSIARAGLEEALFWFRRQSDPVRGKDVYPNMVDLAFHPRASTDTLNPAIGLVQQYPLSESTGLWARVEVRRQADPNDDGVLSASEVDPRAVHDLSAAYFGPAQAGEGLCWSVESLGMVFKPKRPVMPGVGYAVADDEVIARSRAFSEIRRVVPQLPPAAIFMRDADNLTFNEAGTTNAGIQIAGGSGGYAVLYVDPLENPARLLPQLAGGSNHGTANDADWGLSIPRSFGVTLSALKGMADLYVRGTALPSSREAYPEYGLIVIDGDAVFNAAHPFPAGGIVVVNGNLAKEGNIDASFSGIIYVTGDIALQGPGHFSGTMASEGKIGLRSIYGQIDLWQDANSSTYAARRLGEYRLDRAITFIKGTS
jgi:hypothetical protein